MKLYLSQLAVLLLPVTTALAQDGVLKLPMKRSGGIADTLARRSEDNTVDVHISNQLVSYMVDISVGTPAQTLTVILDTGSSDLWFPAATVCPIQPICPYGSFNPNMSSTYNDIGPGEFEIRYADESGARGDYFTDVLEVGGASLENFTMAVGLHLSNQVPGQISGVFGISYPNDESLSDPNDLYHNFPQALVDQGVTKTAAYSLWLDDLNAKSGNILFGGIDTSKFTGELQVLDIQPYRGVYAIFYVILDSVTFTTPKAKTDISKDSALAVLDSGTSFTVVPKEVFKTILSQFTEVGLNQSDGYYTVPCSEANQDKFFTFNFGNSSSSPHPSINVNLSQFVIPNVPGDTQCVLGFDVSDDDTYILGDTFLRSAYAVYDLVNNQIGIAPASFNPGPSHVVAFESHGAKIPTTAGSGATGAATATGSATGTSSAKNNKNAAVSLTGRSLSGATGLGFVAAVVLMFVF